ncbi:MAG: acyl-CoA dehydrogenase family protein [Deltaproteobacteria bacterium]|nr:acyl-CoA dehydrogenase family protein [Deltaproteobacteria bacterium]
MTPFFEQRHRALQESLRGLLLGAAAPFSAPEDFRAVARTMGEPLGLYRWLLPEDGPLDVRALVLVREALAQVSPAADAIFAVQGLGSHPIALAGTEAQRREHLPSLRSGARIGAFALTEPEAGSDVGAIATLARKEPDGWVLDGEKTLISNVGIADQYVVFANATPSLGKKGLTAFLVPSGAPGLREDPLEASAPHPLGRLTFTACRVPLENILGAVGQGFRLAMDTLDAFRITVGGAANGMAARALALSVAHVKKRRQFGAPLADQQMLRGQLAELATELEASRLLVARAAHARDHGHADAGTLAAMCKLFATESAFRAVDRAVQLHGGVGVLRGHPAEALYREVRPLRIYEGTSEIQKLIIARSLLAGGAS